MPILIFAVLLVVGLSATSAYANSYTGVNDDEIPGVYTWSGVGGSFLSESDTDVFREYVYAGEWLHVAVFREPGTVVGGYLYYPPATSLSSPFHISFDYDSLMDANTKWYQALGNEGWYYMNVRPVPGSAMGWYVLRWSREDGMGDRDVSGALTCQLPEMTGYNSTLDEMIDTDDVLALSLERGDRVALSLAQEAGADADFNMLLFGPGTSSVLHGTPVAAGVDGDSAETLTYTADTTGTYYLDIRAASGAGEYWVSISVDLIRMPVYRFYNVTNGAHFYTASAEERDTVIARWPDTYTYEGVAYRVNRANPNNSCPLYRFYNQVNGSHFYTVSEEERYYVSTHWPNIYIYEGPVYNVCASPVSGAAPVYRFYNKKIGTHFYTISTDEKDTVIARWPDTYAFEGPAFWLAR